MRGILEKLPKTLDETYERVLKNINEDNMEHARRLLHCIAVAVRPLRVDDLAEILTFDFDDIEGGIPKYHADWRWKDEEEAVLSTCSSLITVVNSKYDGRVVQFSHFSVKEFLLSDRLASSTPDVSRYHILPGPAHTILVQVCLGCLLHLDDGLDQTTAMSLPLIDYAALFWVEHAQFEDVASRVKDGMRSLFDPYELHLDRWLDVWELDPDPDGIKWDTPYMRNPLYYASLCGFHDLVEHLVINHPRLVNAPYGNFGSPLLAALSGNHVRVAEFLLRHGGKVECRGQNERTPLHFVATDFFRVEFWQVGRNLGDAISDAISFLLKHGADIDSRDRDHCTPLHLAASRDDLEEARILLERGADIDSRNDKGQTPLHMACGTHIGTYEVAKLLSERGAHLNAPDNNLDTPLLKSVFELDIETARILLAHGADPHAKNKDGVTSLHLEISLDYSSGPYLEHTLLEFAPLLLQNGADVNAQNNYYMTPLHVAIEQGWNKVARILLEHGAEPNVTNKDGQTPLHLAFELDSRDNAEILIAGAIHLLLQRGANVNARDKNHTTPLLLAIQRNMYDITRILLARGAKPNVKNVRGKAPLHLLLEGNFADEDDIPGLVHLLLERGADVNAQDQNRTPPLSLAVKRHLVDIARILLQHGAEPNIKDIKNKTPLHVLLEQDHDLDDVDGVLVVVRLLLDSGADVNFIDRDYQSPVGLAESQRRFEVAQIIRHRANAETYWNRAQWRITSEGEYNLNVHRHSVSQFSLERTPDVNVVTVLQNMDLITRLHWACYFGRLELTRELLDNGENANVENIRGETPLHLVSRGQYDTLEDGVGVVQLLLERGANVDAQDKTHITPLHLASYYGKLEIVRVLLDHGAKVNAESELGQTPLRFLLDGNRSGRDGLGVVRLLLERGADVNSRDRDNETPLHLASNYGKLAIGRVLLIHGANANAANIRGWTPLHMLSLWPWRVEDEPSLVEILVDGGADVDARDNDGETPLHTAYRNKRFDVAHRLVRRRANNYSENNKGETPLQLVPQLTVTE